MFGFKNYEQWKVAVLNLVKSELSKSRNTVIKNVTVEQVAIPEKTTSDLQGTSTQGNFVNFYNTTREQFEIWKDGEYIRTLG